MNGLEASARWGCSHTGSESCSWCSNPDGEVWRSVDGYQPIYGFQPTPASVEPAPALTLAEWISKVNPGFWERGATS